MSSSESWTLVEWDDERGDLDNTRSYEMTDENVMVADKTSLKKKSGESPRGKLTAVSDDHKNLQDEQKPREVNPTDDKPEIINLHKSEKLNVIKSETEIMDEEALATLREQDTLNEQSTDTPKPKYEDMKVFPDDKAESPKMYPVSGTSNEYKSETQEGESGTISENNQDVEIRNESDLEKSSGHCLQTNRKRYLDSPISNHFGSEAEQEFDDNRDPDVKEVLPRKKMKTGLINQFGDASNLTSSLRAIIPHQIHKSRENIMNSQNPAESRRKSTDCTKCQSQREASNKRQLRFVIKIQKLINKSIGVYNSLKSSLERFEDVLELTDLMDAEDLKKYLVAGILSVHSEEYRRRQSQYSLSQPNIDNDFDQDMEYVDVENDDHLSHNQEINTMEPVIDLKTENENTTNRPESPDVPTTVNLRAAANAIELEAYEANPGPNVATNSPKPNETLINFNNPMSPLTTSSVDGDDDEEFEGPDMIAIGCGNTFVNKSSFEEIDWSSYTLATRKLLTLVFNRDVLESDTLTEKISAAFPDKPAKRCLNQRKVNDIVMTVTEKCKVKENLVRQAITIKCAEEYRRGRPLKKASLFSNKEYQTPTNGSE